MYATITITNSGGSSNPVLKYAANSKTTDVEKKLKNYGVGTLMDLDGVGVLAESLSAGEYTYRVDLGELYIIS